MALTKITGEGIGTLTSGISGTDITLSGGAYLGGTGSANYLDDYEEGTWTPTFTTNTGNGASGTFSNTQYTKIGNMVYITAHVLNIDTSGTTASGQLRISNLPYTIDIATTIGAAYSDNVTLDSPRTQLNSEFHTLEYIRFRQTGGSATDLALEHDNIDASTSDLYFSGFYYTYQ